MAGVHIGNNQLLVCPRFGQAIEMEVPVGFIDMLHHRLQADVPFSGQENQVGGNPIVVGFALDRRRNVCNWNGSTRDAGENDRRIDPKPATEDVFGIGGPLTGELHDDAWHGAVQQPRLLGTGNMWARPRISLRLRLDFLQGPAARAGFSPRTLAGIALDVCELVASHGHLSRIVCTVWRQAKNLSH
jgi:hypothetical protein